MVQEITEALKRAWKEIKEGEPGSHIALLKYQQEREQYYKDLRKELNANLNPKSW